jgi:hypothetical protein
MEPEDEERWTDRWLDAALDRYSKVEAPAGLEERILRRIREQPRPQRHPIAWWLSCAAAGLAAVVLGAAWLRDAGPQSGPRPAQTARVSPLPTPRAAATPAPEGRGPGRLEIQRTGRRQPPVVAAVRSVVPRRERFPTPTPLSEQEELLMRYVREFPREAVLMARAQGELLARESREWEQAAPKTEE